MRDVNGLSFVFTGARNLTLSEPNASGLFCVHPQSLEAASLHQPRLHSCVRSVQISGNSTVSSILRK